MDNKETSQNSKRNEGQLEPLVMQRNIKFKEIAIEYNDVFNISKYDEDGFYLVDGLTNGIEKQLVFVAKETGFALFIGYESVVPQLLEKLKELNKVA